MKNNPRVLEESEHDGLVEKTAEEKDQQKPMTEKEKRIKALRDSLLAPPEPRRKK